MQTMQQDFDADLRVEKIEFNPFVLSLRINGLELDNPAGDPTLRVQEIFGNFQLSSIFRLALTFAEIRFTAPELFIARDKSGNLDIAYLVNAGGSAETETEDSNEPVEDSSLLQGLIHNFTIEEFFVNWSDAVPAEPVETRFGPVNIAIQELNTLPNRSGQQSIVIVTESSGTLRWTGDLQLNPLLSSGTATLEESRFPLISAYIRHQLGVEIVDGSGKLEFDYQVSTTDAGQIKASITNLDLSFANIRVNSFADGTGIDLAGADQQILGLPGLRLAGGELHWPEKTLSLESITIDNPQIDMSRDANGVFNLEPRQTSPGEPVAGTAVSQQNPADAADSSQDEEWQLSIDNLAINDLVLNLLDQTVNPGAKLGITNFNLDIRNISNLPEQRFPTNLSLQALSGGEISLSGELAVLPQPVFEFDVNVDALQLAGAHPYLKQQANVTLDSGALNLDGHISGTAEEPLAFKGNLEVVDLSLAESINDKRLVSWKSFRAERIALSLAGRQLDISRLRFDQLYGDILIDEDGSLNLGQVQKGAPGALTTDTGNTEQDSATVSQAEAQDTEPVAADSAADSAEPGNAMKIRIGDIALANGSADFKDLSLPLPFAVKIDALNGKMTTISTESNEPSEVSLEGKVDEFGLARVGGTITPLDPTKNTNLLVAFDNIDVPSFTPYSIPFAGREIASGKLDLKLGYEVRDSEMAGENSIILRDFELGKEVPHPDAMDVPLGLAVALLKDANGRIDIDLPVRGNVNDPDFSYGGVVLRALGNLLVKIVLSPFTALGSMLGIEASELEFVNFLDGRADLTPPEMEKAGKLAEALALRPELQLTIGGVYDAAADGIAIRTATLDTLLEQRVTELTASSDPETQYADLRRQALEQMYSEQMQAGTVTLTLDELRTQFTALVEIEGQAEPQPSLDRLAYANRLRAQLIELQEVQQSDLDTLANARAEALKTALLAIDVGLQERVSIDEIQAITRAQDEPIKMQISLAGKSAPTDSGSAADTGSTSERQ